MLPPYRPLFTETHAGGVTLNAVDVAVASASAVAVSV